MRRSARFVDWMRNLNFLHRIADLHHPYLVAALREANLSTDATPVAQQPTRRAPDSDLLSSRHGRAARSPLRCHQRLGLGAGNSCSAVRHLATGLPTSHLDQKLTLLYRIAARTSTRSTCSGTLRATDSHSMGSTLPLVVRMLSMVSLVGRINGTAGGRQYGA